MSGFLPFLFLICFATVAVAQTGADSVRSMRPVPLRAEEVCPILPGATIPSVAVRADDGSLVMLDSLVRARPTIVIFYRGGWCPYCNTHLQEIQDVEKEILKLGYQIIAISPDRPELLGTTKGRHKLRYQLLSDSDMDAARAFGLAFQLSDETVRTYRSYNIDIEESSGRTHHMLPVPAAYVIGTDGTVLFGYVNANYTARVDGALLLAAARSAVAKK